jgi:hypothetical protein
LGCDWLKKIQEAKIFQQQRPDKIFSFTSNLFSYIAFLWPDPLTLTLWLSTAVMKMPMNGGDNNANDSGMLSMEKTMLMPMPMLQLSAVGMTTLTNGGDNNVNDCAMLLT